MLDFSGLAQPTFLADVKADVAAPEDWRAIPPQVGPLFVHRQWRSPSHDTGMGVAHVKLFWPVGPEVLIWFAKTQYARHASATGRPEGRLLGEWTDPLGRRWFEAENEYYHVRGYAQCDGFDAWVVYTGYRITVPARWPELATAQRAVDAVVPRP